MLARGEIPKHEGSHQGDSGSNDRGVEIILKVGRVRLRILRAFATTSPLGSSAPPRQSRCEDWLVALLEETMLVCPASLTKAHGFRCCLISWPLFELAMDAVVWLVCRVDHTNLSGSSLSVYFCALRRADGNQIWKLSQFVHSIVWCNVGEQICKLSQLVHAILWYDVDLS